MGDREPHRNLLAAAIVLAIAASATDPARAQAGTGESGEEATTLATTTVTAQKREEQLQDVPISMTVLSEQLLRDAGARDIKEMQILTPGLTVTSTGNEAQTTARIHGIGTVGDNPGLESSVGVVIDGVYRPRNGVGFGDLGEIERIEVLKGPQGTVFGKNTSAGLVNVVTRKPGRDTELSGELTVGDYGARGIAGAANAPLGDAAAFRVYAVARERDGFSDVRTGAGPRTSNRDGDQDFHSARAQLFLTPGSDVDINLAVDTTRRDEECCTGVTTVRGPTAAIVDALASDEGVLPIADPERRLAYSNRGTGQDVEDQGAQAELNWVTPWFDRATLTSITAYRDWQSINGADLDFSTADIWYRDFGKGDASAAFETFSQELRLTGTHERVDWMVGLFYADEDLDRRDQTIMGSAYEAYLSIALLGRVAGSFPAGLVNTANGATFLSQAAGRTFGTSFVGEGARDTHLQDSRNLALFTNNTWHATDALDLTLGLRYTAEDKSLESRYQNPDGGVGCAAALANPQRVGAALAGRGVPLAALGAVVPTVIGFMCLPWTNPLHDGRENHQERSENEWSGTFKVAYRWNDAVMTYGSAARGYKAGGFNLDRVQSSNGLTSGGTGITPITDTSFPGEFVDAYELGAKTTWMGGNLLLNASLFHQEYSDFQLNSFLGTSYVVRAIPEVTSNGIDAELLWKTAIPGLMLQGGVTYADSEYGDDLLPDADLSKLPGSRISFAPLWSSTAAVTYERPVFDSLLARLNVGAKYNSEYNTGSDLDLEKLQPGYTLVNARIGLGARDRSWMLEAWAQNLTDRTYKQVGFDAPLQTGSWNAFLAPPRTYGLTLRVTF